MSKDVTYKIPIENLNEVLDGTLNPIKDTARLYHQLLRQNISQFSKTGGLLNSWKFEIFNETNASIYSNKPYARAQDKGAKIRITSKMRNFAWHMYKKTKNSMWKAIAITKKKFITLPAKNYSKVDLGIIKNYIEIVYGN